MKKLTRRLLALTLAILMVSALVLNVSALSYNIELPHPYGFTYYLDGSCSSTAARVSTACDSRNPAMYVQSKGQIVSRTANDTNLMGAAVLGPYQVSGSVVNLSSEYPLVLLFSWHYGEGVMLQERTTMAS